MSTAIPRSRNDVSEPHGAAVCVWLTGLSGAGKSTTARSLAAALAARRSPCTVLDGDELRGGLCADLGFSKEDRDANVLRVATLAKAVVDTGQVVVCALISPYRGARDRARQLIGHDRFVEVFVDAPLAACEARDPKGLYARARSGSLVGLTGIDDPYEPPLVPELVLTTTDCTVEEGVTRIVDWLAARAMAAESRSSVVSRTEPLALTPP